MAISCCPFPSGESPDWCSQHQQVYGNQFGMPLGRPGNGLGDVWSTLADDDWDTWEGGHSHPRPSRGSTGVEWDDPTTAQIELGDLSDVGLPEILLAMAALTERQRFVLECRYGLRPGMDGKRLSQREIASLMGINQSNVARYEQEAIQRLRERLARTASKLV